MAWAGRVFDDEGLGRRGLARTTVLLVICSIMASADAMTITKNNLKMSANPAEGLDDILGAPLSAGELDSSGALPVHKPPNDAVLDETGLFQGDIEIDAPHNKGNEIDEEDEPEDLSALRDPSLRWKDAVVPYTISSKYSKNERMEIAHALHELMSKTCIKFKPRDKEVDYIHIFKGSGCYSHVGRQGKEQRVSLGKKCAFYGVAMHEIIHALGFWHEQSRDDREGFIKVHWDNIRKGMESNFNKKREMVTQQLGQPYDYDSLMHYRENSFAKDSKVKTIEPMNKGVKIGQRTHLSQLDIKSINLLYDCKTKEAKRGKEKTNFKKVMQMLL